MSTCQRLARHALPAVLLATLGGCATDYVHNRSVASVHQPVVSYQSFVYDAAIGPNGGLAPAEEARLEGWLSSIDIRYGDSVAIASQSGDYGPAMRDGISAVVGRHGLLLQRDDTAQAGRAPMGSVRLIVRRADAAVPGCPDWAENAENTMLGAASSNYGCGVNGNLAAMIANPNDLVRGQTTDSALRTATSNRAIKTYEAKTPTGSGDLKTLSAGGN